MAHGRIKRDSIKKIQINEGFGKVIERRMGQINVSRRGEKALLDPPASSLVPRSDRRMTEACGEGEREEKEEDSSPRLSSSWLSRSEGEEREDPAVAHGVYR